MAKIGKRTISLPSGQSAYIDAKVRAGEYASASEVIHAGVRALRERDEAVERWLQNEVAPVYDAMNANPARAIPAESAFGEVRARKGKGTKGGNAPYRQKVVFPFKFRAVEGNNPCQ